MSWMNLMYFLSFLESFKKHTDGSHHKRNNTQEKWKLISIHFTEEKRTYLSVKQRNQLSCHDGVII